MNKSSQNTLRAVAAAATLLALTAGARAADVAQVHVKYADLNISSPAGAAVLYRRIRVAADQVCGEYGGRGLARIARAQACADKAIADAVASVGNDTLNSVYAAKTGSVVGAKLAAN